MATGWFWWARPAELLACRWTAESELVQFLEAAPDGPELARLQASLCDLDRFLGPYPYEGGEGRQVASFRQSLRHLDEAGLRSIVPDRVLLSAVSPLAPQSASPPALRLSRLPSEGDLVRMHATYVQDRTAALRQLHLDHWRLLGEMELCFVLLTLLHNFEAFEHWRDGCALLCHCGQLMHADPAFYGHFCAVLAAQFVHIPPELFEPRRRGNRLLRWLQILYEDCQAVRPPHPELARSCRRLAAAVRQQLSWDLAAGAESEEEAPTIVEL